jgi:hypothetical protein
MSSVKFVVGNTYREIPQGNAKLDRTHKFRKVHDWTLYVDIVEGSNVDVIQHVTFDMQNQSFQPSVFQHAAPVKVTRPDGTVAWRFSTRQQTYAMISCAISLIGRGGSKVTVTHTVKRKNCEDSNIRIFKEKRPLKALGPVALPDVRFGIELELTSDQTHPPAQVARTLQQQAGRTVAVMTEHGMYREAHASHEHWKLMSDSSIMCHINRPDCHAFELVSPILKGQTGLAECKTVLAGISRVGSIKVNKSMGFHVHVDVTNVSRKGLICICQNFLKYEEVMDVFMPPSRRNNTFCKSNKNAVRGSTNKQRHEALASSRTIKELCATMNPGPGERHYKLNLQNLATGRQQTIEFRQHSSSVAPEKVLNWIRFCVSFVTNSIRCQSPSAMGKNKVLSEQLDLLNQYVIKDRYLGTFYTNRVKELRTRDREEGEGEEACCSGCANGGSCSTTGGKGRNVRHTAGHAHHSEGFSGFMIGSIE